MVERIPQIVRKVKIGLFGIFSRFGHWLTMEYRRLRLMALCYIQMWRSTMDQRLSLPQPTSIYLWDTRQTNDNP